MAAPKDTFKTMDDRKSDGSAEHLETPRVPSPEDPNVLDADVAYGPGGMRGIISSPYVFGAAALASLGGFSMGYDQGVISIINEMEQFHAVYPRAVTAFGKGFMTGMLLLGAFIGCLFMSYLADKISRKWALTVVVVIFDIGAIMQTASPNYAILVAGRAIGGIGVGTLAMTAPLYISEVAPPNLRGTLLVLESISIVSGVIIAFWITFGTQHMAGEISFRLPFGLQMVCATLLGTCIHFFPYSPRWLAMVDRHDECLTSLCKLRNLPASDSRIQTEFKSIIAEKEYQRAIKARNHPGATGLKLEALEWRDLLTRKMWRRTVVGVGVAFFQQFSGINAFIYYAPTLFQSIGQDAEMATILSGVFNCLQLVAVLVCFVVIDRVGRRPLAMFGAFGCFACYMVIAILSALYEKDWASHTDAGWACAAMAFVFIMIYGISYSPLGWALPAEAFSTSSRAKGVALSTAVIWLSNFIIAVAIPPMLETIKYGTYIFFAVMCFLAGIWAFFLVPETKGKTLEELDAVFGDVEESDLMAIAVEKAKAAHIPRVEV